MLIQVTSCRSPIKRFVHPLAKDGKPKNPRNPDFNIGDGGLADREGYSRFSMEWGVCREEFGEN
jgi:hypothetical protein